MERRLNKKLEVYLHQMKSDIAEQFQHVKNKEITDYNIMENQYISIIDYLYKYDNLQFNNEDFVKRKRVKNVVPNYERCSAKRANGEQCTRRKKDDSSIYCGTHYKGTPHGVINESNTAPTSRKIQVSAIDIKGIVYYLDDNGNVYDTEDILSNIKNPRVIAQYEKNGQEYSIPELFNR